MMTGIRFYLYSDRGLFFMEVAFDPMFSITCKSCIRRIANAIAILFLAAFFLLSAARAQSADSAGLEVYVRDASGAVISDAKVHIAQTQENIMRDGVSDKNGYLRFTELPVGDYVVTVEKNGFGKLVESGITLDVGQISTMNLAMKIASESTQINVIASTPIIDTDRTSFGQTISSEEIENLPSSSRSFLDFALTVPGITSNASSGQGSGLSANGGRQRSNSILVDGVENNGLLNGTVRQTVSIDAVQAFDVITDNFLPEYGQASGAVINVITKSGTQTMHGSVYYFARNPAMNAQGYCFNSSHTDCSGNNFLRNDFGATMGGPLYKAKTFYFASAEYLGQSMTQVSTINGSTAISGTNPLTPVADINSALAAGFVVGSGVKSINNNGIYSPYPLTLGSMRVDHTMNEHNTFLYRLIYAHYDNANPAIDSDDGSLSDYSNYGKDVLQAYSMMGEWTHIISPSLLNEAHFQFAPQYLTQQANSTGVTTHIAGNVEFGPNPLFPSLLNETHYEWIDALSWTRGKHFVKLGGDITYVRAQTTLPNEVNGYWHFASIGSWTLWNPSISTSACSSNPTSSTFGCGFPDAFHQAFGNPGINFSDKLIALYAEDQWKATSRLSINYGVRYDLDLQPQGYNLNMSDPIQAPLPKGIPRNHTNFGPRLGFALSLNKGGTTVLRGGYGMFYDRLFLILARDALLSRVTLDDFTPGNTGAQMKAMFAAGPYPHTYNFPTALVIPSVPSITSIAPKLPMPVAHEASLFLDQALTKDWELEVGGIFISGQKLIRANNTNLEPSVILTTANQASLGFATYGASGFQPTPQQYGRPFYGANRLNPTYNDITTYTSSGHATYSGLRASLVHRITPRFTMRTSYVWSKTIDDSDDYNGYSEPTNPYVPQQEKGLSIQDQRHNFASAAIYHMPYEMQARHNSPLRMVFGNWTASYIVLLHSGTPENIVTDNDSNGDGEDNDRPYTNLANCTACSTNNNAGGIITGRNSFRGPRSESVQFRMQKDYVLQNDTKFTFSVEAFNLFNHVNFTDANTDWGTNLAPNSNYGTFDAAATPRSIQLGLKYQF